MFFIRLNSGSYFDWAWGRGWKKDIDGDDKHNIILGVNVYYESKILGVVS